MASVPVPKLLREHARTFALTLRLLPRALREPLSIAYLLARASDTVADAGNLPVEQRLLALKALDESFCPDLDACHPMIGPVEEERLTLSERELLAAVPAILAALDRLPERNILLFLWGMILQGQIMDLERFTPEAEPLTRKELEFYCNLVAGFVGNVWTQLIALHFPNTLLRPKDEMRRLGVAYGNGLQLLNILRDRIEDRAAGRFYIREEDVPGMIELTASWLADAESYCRNLSPGRIRYATEMPLRLAWRTLELIRKSPQEPRVKISRSEVTFLLIRSLPSLVLPRRCNPAS